MSTSQPNGVPPPSSASQPASSGTTTVPNTQVTNNLNHSMTTATSATMASQSQNPNHPTSPTTGGGPSSSSQAPRPRDARTIELLLTSQGVTSFDSRVPLLLLDFAYRHTSSILHDAIHLSGDPYTTHAGAKPSGSSGAIPVAPPGGDASVSANAVNIAIASRQAYQFRGGSGGGGGGGGGGGSAGGVGGGGTSKEWLQELARERNRIALPRVLANEWGLRLPNERFVLSGQNWGLKDELDGGEDTEEDDEDDDTTMNGAEGKKDGEGNKGGDGKEGEGGGGLDEYLGDDLAEEEEDEEDEEMEGME
ncbi:transcription initiation factor IID, 31kD subunit-domain-containing protein [Xylariaceae sp. FL0255]|nr:transcription initiation factor IID, 31kD subunit-domain-containing protein [Xylariaceae sp. FL0255]